jgi:hypothetical protein
MVLRWAREAGLQAFGNLQFNAHILGGTYIGQFHNHFAVN